MIHSVTLSVSGDIQLVPPRIPQDASSIFEALHTHRESLRVWLPFVDFTHSLQDSENYLYSLKDSDEMVFIIHYRNRFAGLAGLKNPDRENKKVEIGYWLVPTCEGKGIMTRSCRRLIEYAFDKMDMNRILIQVYVENRKSRRIPERLGFQEEGIEREGELLVSGFSDVVKYGLLKREYNGNN
ncbi:MAG: GNAT family N-acetyltransferase [Tannerellaceae bacterium]|nr:GNAT family N-acetyltransferase [Tannerellaceae bacterium]